MILLLISLWLACGIAAIKIAKDVLPKFNFNRPTRLEALAIFLLGIIGLVITLYGWVDNSEWWRKRI